MEQLPERMHKLKELTKVLSINKERYSKLIVDEMGKPIQQARSEIDKTIGHIKYYVENSAQFLATEELNLSSGQKGAVYTQPLGTTVGKSFKQ